MKTPFEAVLLLGGLGNNLLSAYQYKPLSYGEYMHVFGQLGRTLSSSLATSQPPLAVRKLQRNRSKQACNKYTFIQTAAHAKCV